MEWGIVRGNDPYLYGEKVKAYLRRGARELPGYSEWPNAQLGYGALCVRDSLPDWGMERCAFGTACRMGELLPFVNRSILKSVIY